MTGWSRWFFIVSMLAFSALPARADDALWQKVKQGGVVLLMRHAQTEPGVGDPANFSLDDCSTQRNLSAAGKEQARRIGDAFRARGIALEQVRSSAWCRCMDTARIAFGRATPWPALNSFFQGRGSESAQTAEVKSAAASLKPPGVWMLVTHQVNITALTGEWADTGEIIVTRPSAGGGLEVVGRLSPR